MLSEEEKEMSTKSKINSLINDIQNKLNKRVPNNYVPYKNIYNQGNNKYMSNPPSILTNNFMSLTNPSSVYQQPSFNSSLNEYALRAIIKEEFSSLILPYQKDLILNQKNVDERLSEMEKKSELIINAQTMGNFNDNAKIISTYLSSNLSNDNSKKNLEKLKIECDNKFNKLENEVNSLMEQIKIINEEKNKSEENFENFKKNWENKEKEKEKKEKNRENKLYLEKNVFDSEINKINQKFIDDNNTNEENIQKINDEINNLSKSLNQFKLEINKINGLNNNINSIRGELGKITEDISSLKYQVTPDIIDKINSIDFNKLKQQVSLIEFNKLKNDMNNFDNNFYSVKNTTESNDRSISDLKIIMNDIEQKQSLINKNIEENITEKIKELSNKIEELSKKEKEKEEKKEEKKEEINNANNNNETEKEKKDEEPDLFIGSSRRQQRNNKSINSNVNNNSKNQNSNLDEKSMALIKQLEKINLEELQNMNFNGLLNQIGDLSRENKILSDKIEQQNKTIAEINERLNKLSLDNNQPKISNVYQKRNIEVNENNKAKEKKDSFMEDDYDDFDKDFNSDNKNDIKADLEKEKEKENITPKNDINNNTNNKNNLIEDSNYRKDILQKSKNEFGSFSKFSEANILDQIMGIGDNNKKPGLGLGFPEQKFGGGSTFITGSLNENNNNKFNFNEKPQIFEEEKIKNENKSKELNNDLNNKKEENNDDDNFDDFDVDEI